MERKRKLQHQVTDNFNSITERIESDFISKNEAVISPGLEHPSILRHSELLANLFAQTRPDDYAIVSDRGMQPHPGAMRAAYLGVHFASVLHEVVGISADNIELSYGFTAKINANNDTLEEAMNNVRGIAETYLAENPEVEKMINYFIPDIDPTGRYSEIAEIATALTCAQIYVGTELEQHRQAIEDWDGSE